MDATWASCRSPVGPAGSYHWHGLRHSSGHLCSWCSSCVPLGTGLPRTRWPNTAAPHRPAAPDRRVASRFDRRRCGRACTDMRPSGRARFRVRARRVARVVHAETARVRPGALTLTDDAFRVVITSLVCSCLCSSTVVQGVEVDPLREERGDLGQGGDNSGHVGCPGCRGGSS